MQDFVREQRPCRISNPISVRNAVSVRILQTVLLILKTQTGLQNFLDDITALGKVAGSHEKHQLDYAETKCPNVSTKKQAYLP